MPRTARLDIPGLLHHVIVRGIERRPIFADNYDRQTFCHRFSGLLAETETSCLAWSLLPNHFHLLLRPEKAPLSHFMRRLLTGYAVNFNIRHKRSGHLFQNRYKSLLCEEETYCLELVRYIHLNPLRARLVVDLEQLDVYPWCGHAVVLGNRSLEGHKVNETLLHFGEGGKKARQAYREFIADGIALHGRWQKSGRSFRQYFSELLAQDDDLAKDSRVLGSEDFCVRLQRQGQIMRGAAIQRNIPLAELLRRTSALLGLPAELPLERNRSRPVADARALFCCIAVRKLGHNGAEVGRLLGLSRAGVSAAAKRGEKLLAEFPGWQDDLVN